MIPPHGIRSKMQMHRACSCCKGMLAPPLLRARETEAGSSKAACRGGLEPQPCAHGFCTAVAWSSPTIAPDSSTPAKVTPWFTPQYPLHTWLLVWGECRFPPGVIPPFTYSSRSTFQSMFPNQITG